MVHALDLDSFRKYIHLAIVAIMSVQILSFDSMKLTSAETGHVQSISEVQDGFVKAPESVFGEPHPSRKRVKNAHRIVVKVRPDSSL